MEAKLSAFGSNEEASSSGGRRHSLFLSARMVPLEEVRLSSSFYRTATLLPGTLMSLDDTAFPCAMRVRHGAERSG